MTSIYDVGVRPQRLPWYKFAAALLATCLALDPVAQALDPVPAAAVSSINEPELKMHLEFLAAPEFGGRYTLSPSFQVAAKYLATRLEAYGYQGAAKDGTFMQRFDVKTATIVPDQSTITVSARDNSTTFSYGEFFNAGLASGEFKGEIAFVGYGISSPRLKHDDYAALDVKGKIVLSTPGNPKTIDTSQLRDDEWKEGAAKKHGAVALIYLPRTYEVEWMKQASYREASLRKTGLAADKNIPIVRASPTLAEKLLESGDVTYTDVLSAQRSNGGLKGKVLPISAHLKLTSNDKFETTQNVVGWLEGADPKLRHEYISFSAHYDHLRTNSKGQVYPGANDDGSGTVGVLSIAKAMANDRPRRSVLIIFHAAEEMGLLGSEYNADIEPVKPLPDMIANFNMDMIGSSRPVNDTNEKNKQKTPPNTIYVIGADRTSQELHAINEQTNRETVKLKFDYLLNDPSHPDQIFYRSDHWNYGKHGVPFIFYFDGVGEDYHKPTDTLEKIDYDKLTKVTRLAFAAGWRVANQKQRIKAKVN
jgi:hypothetical protein